MDIDCIDTTEFWIIEEEIPDFGDEEVNNIINQNNPVRPEKIPIFCRMAKS